MSVQALAQSKTRIVIGGLLALSLLVGGMFFAPAKASAAPPCDGGANGLPFCVGYFYGGFSPGIQHHLYGPPPGPGLQVENTPDLINTIRARIACLDPGTPSGRFSLPQNNQNATSAAFTILTMLGAPPGTPKNMACVRWAEWEDIIWTYSNAGLITYHFAYNSGGVNTRSSIDDVQYYSSNVTPDAIIFRNPSNPAQILYAIKRDCGNPIGQLLGLTRNYNLTPAINPRVNNQIKTQAEPGDTIYFEYGVTNTGTTRSAVANCYGGAINRLGYHGGTDPAEGGGVPLILVACPGAFNPGNNYAGGPEIAFTAVANMSYCRTLFVTPISQSNPGTNSIEVCINVVSKPYVKVFGGDVSTGNGLESVLNSNSCSTNNNAAIIAWNNGTAGGYSGAGAQYAAQSPARIGDFGTAQGNVGGGAPPPTGLAFANTSVNLGAGTFGGSWGSVKCARNYYGERALLGALPNVSSLAAGTGTYEATSDTTLGNLNLGANDRWTIYIDGDLRITNNITFSSGWTPSTMPFFKIVVLGNIYVGGNVTQLDGIYIAQADGATGGTIYTCATGSPLAAPTLANGAFYNACTNKLTVNGALVANSVELSRTRGTLRNATTNETSASTNISESINFGPAAWMFQPPQGTGRVDNYDAITSLPPVL